MAVDAERHLNGGQGRERLGDGHALAPGAANWSPG